MSDGSNTTISDEKLSKLMSKIQSDKSLASKLGVLVPTKRKNTSFSPLKVRKYIKNASGKFVPIEDIPANAGRPDEIAHVNETSTSGPSIQSNIINPGSPHSESYDNDSDHNSDSESENDTEVDNLENLEKILCTSDNEDEIENESDEEEEIEVLGGPKKAAWSPSKKSKSFYLKAADIELNKDLIKEISEQYDGSEDTNSHFSPPRFSSALWSTVQTSQSDTFRLKSLHKIQDHLYLAIKPLLDCLDTADKSSKEKIVQSIQLICSSNLLLNRYRRATVVPHLKPELRKQILSIPITHNSFFGDDFAKTTDNLIKEQSAIEKVIQKKPVNQRLHYRSSSHSRGNSYSSGQYNTDRKSFRGSRGSSFKYSQRGRGSRRGSNHPRRGGYKSDKGKTPSTGESQ